MPRQEPGPEEVRRLAERILEQLEMMGLNLDDIEKAVELIDIHSEELAELMYLGDMCGCNPEALIDLVASGRSGELVCENGAVAVAKHPDVTKVYGCGDEVELLI